MRATIGLAVLLAAMVPAACRPGAPAAEPEPVAPALSSTPATAAESARAAGLLAEARRAYEAGDLARARRVAREVVERYPGAQASSQALLLEARAAHDQGDLRAAIALAERYAGLFPPGSRGARPAMELIERARAELAAAGAAGTPALAVVVPQSGSPYLKQYGELILEGVRLAVAEHEAAGGRTVELLVLDDEGSAARAAALVAGLQGGNAFGVVGPLLSEAMVAAAAARPDSGLVLLSPTASDPAPRGAPNVYTLNAAGTWGAEALARYAVGRGLRRAATLYPRGGDHARQAHAFAAALTAAGGRIVAAEAYEPGTTTFAEPLGRIAAARPDVLFVPVPTRDVRQIAPQLTYYGVGDLPVLGGESWTEDEVLRLVEPRDLEGVVAATRLVREGESTMWRDFAEAYARAYRRSLDNPLPALGYDAARLLLGALPDGRVAPGVVAARLRPESTRGAAGVYAVRDGQVERRPFLVRIEGRELRVIGAAERGVP